MVGVVDEIQTFTIRVIFPDKVIELEKRGAQLKIIVQTNLTVLQAKQNEFKKVDMFRSNDFTNWLDAANRYRLSAH